MTERANFGDSLLNWISKQNWNWAIWLQNPAGASSKKTAGFFREWIAEIEQADGTLEFRWIRLTTQQKDGELDGMLVLVGGLRGGENLFWLERWRAISGDSKAHAGLLYRPGRRGMHLKPILEDELGDRKFDVVMRAGPRKIQRARTMQVDDEGQPTEERVKRILRATFLERERLRQSEEISQKMEGRERPIGGAKSVTSQDPPKSPKDLQRQP
jgi:hypothetical protein